MPACIMNNIPYLAYIHTLIAQMKYNDIYNWYMNNYSIYRDLFKIYFDLSYRNISITNSASKLNADLFKINKKIFSKI